MNNNKIDIIIPAFKAQNTILRTLSSNNLCKAKSRDLNSNSDFKVYQL